ncbi:glycosyl transferase family protein [Novosphingobium sp. H3SJ31-1]|uniref:Glycosyl transferase family protein n=2 Tax=Novosphingobium album (ex Liu et al. 2023) TaxID=3031130 RepID=A0ABT5WRH5_9SPHN|nr:glycosyl transferase family protein [Novosphingobium album (ex Liu et al. 2023)]MDE8652644.1 glycosyl transferase family protein [Novosphingobium album (ex Liu et al. 2023)]
MIEHELLLFAAFWFVLGAIDETVIDGIWLALRLTGRTREPRVPRAARTRPLSGRAAVLVPAWNEADVIGHMIAHTLRAWPRREWTLYVGCYANDPATTAAAMAAAADDPRVRIVIHAQSGPTTKADCLNRLYAALCADEARGRFRYASIVLHDAEDMVHPCALATIDEALRDVEFVQLPVRPEPQPASPWVAGHYADEFAEAHAKTLVVRDALGAGLPAAGVGCGFSRETMALLARKRIAQGEDGPFATGSLTEDYELGLQVSHDGARARFVRCRDEAGALIATRAFFPARFDESVRQKTRWIHGIALQGWDRLGWRGGLIDLWMKLRDRRGPLMALVLATAYALLVIEALLALFRLAGWQGHVAVSPVLALMVTVCLVSLIWRMVWRAAFTASEYGLAEGLRSVPRTIVANTIAIIAGRRALFAYVRTLRGAGVAWDKTRHRDHPAAGGSGEGLAREGLAP